MFIERFPKILLPTQMHFMNNLSPFLILNCPCDEALQWISQNLTQNGLRLGGSLVFTVMNDFPHCILAWRLTPTMNASDAQDTPLLALQKNNLGHVLVEHRPRLLSDNSSCYISKELRLFLEHRHMEHTFSAPYHPMMQGTLKNTVQTIERYHHSMKNIVNLQN